MTDALTIQPKAHTHTGYGFRREGKKWGRFIGHVPKVVPGQSFELHAVGLRPGQKLNAYFIA